MKQAEKVERLRKHASACSHRYNFFCSEAAEKLLHNMQEELHMTKDDFQARFGDDPRRDDLTLLNPKQDDPTEQVTPSQLLSKSANSFLVTQISVCVWAYKLLPARTEVSHQVACILRDLYLGIHPSYLAWKDIWFFLDAQICSHASQTPIRCAQFVLSTSASTSRRKKAAL